MKLMVLILLLSIPCGISIDPSNYFIVWNVGQGSWSTLVKGHQCLHFDAGGEKFPEAVEKLCSTKKNAVYISHDDWDHIKFLKRIFKWRHICIANKPRNYFSPSKERLIGKFPYCPDFENEIAFNPQGNTANDLSRVYYLKTPGVLLPGDSSRSAEKIWAQKISRLKIKWWLLGHHGSLTSSSKLLIEKVGQPLAIASARWKVYRHPHPLVVARLRQRNIPTLRTEDWGHFWIQID